jgi:hypothetical protein
VDRPLYVYRVHGQSLSQVDRLQQIAESRDAIPAALKRRGLDHRLELKVEITAKFSLIDRTKGASPAGVTPGSPARA